MFNRWKRKVSIFTEISNYPVKFYLWKRLPLLLAATDAHFLLLLLLLLL